MADATHNVIYTIGHSNHDDETFLGLLARHDVSAVVDVRSVPFSRYISQFNRKTIEERLNEKGIDYHFMGNWLGGRSDDPGDYDPDGQVQYDLLSKSERFLEAMESVVRGSREHRLALMCSEGRPEECHRSLLLAEELRNWHEPIEVVHILPDGSIQSMKSYGNGSHGATKPLDNRICSCPTKRLYR